MARDLLPDMTRQKPYQPESWTAKHRYIVSLEMAGLTVTQIAEVMDMDISRISVILNDDRAQHDRDTIGKDVADKVSDVHLRFRLLAHEALDELEEQMRGAEDVKVRQKAVLAILDRGGYSKYQGEHVPRPQVGEDAAKRIEEALGDLKRIAAPDYKLPEPQHVKEADFEVVEREVAPPSRNGTSGASEAAD